MTGPLAGVTIVEVGQAIAGPYATTVLGDLGADVIKVEQPGGGPQRTTTLESDRHGHESFTWRFLTLNRSKRSIVVDLKTPDGQDVLARLLEDADVLIENLRSGVLERLGFPWVELQETLPELVYCSISGYGETGPYRDWPSLDTTVQGVSGFASQVGDKEEPESMDVYVIDMLTGIYAALGILAALHERADSGVGQRVDVSMLDTAVSLLGWQLADYSAAQRDESYEPSYGPSFAPNGHFETADGYLTAFVPPQIWPAFCDLLGRPEWTDEDHRYGTPEDRLADRQALREEIEAILAERTTEEWIDRFTSGEEYVTVAPTNDIEGMVEDPQIQAVDAVVERTHSEMGEHVVPNIVPAFSRTPGSISDAPTLGGDTDAVLGALGFSERERERLRLEGAIR